MSHTRVQTTNGSHDAQAQVNTVNLPPFTDEDSLIIRHQKSLTEELADFEMEQNTRVEELESQLRRAKEAAENSADQEHER